jgi:heat shock protein HtpX
MTLYTQAESNIRKTWLYLTLFIVLILLLGWFFSNYFGNFGIFWFALIFSTLSSFFSYWYSDKIVLALTKARPIEKSDNPELYRIVENLCITAGLPLPKIYILDEAQPNAFATGRDKNHAVIAVTQGLLEKMDKTELEGVIAHELSHIGNKDLLLETMVVVLVGLVVMLADIFWRMSFWGRQRRRERDEEGNAIFFLIGMVLVILAPILAQLIKFAISRKREFLADEAGALLTRYPEGLASALEKISRDQNPLSVANNATSHLYIANPLRGSQIHGISKLFMTHPPIEERIRALRELHV